MALADGLIDNDENVASSKKNLPNSRLGGAVASWLVSSTPDRAVRVRALAMGIVLCSWARHLTSTVPLSTQVLPMLWVTLRRPSIPSRGSRNIPNRLMLQKPG